MRKKTRIKNKENLSVVPSFHAQFEEHAKSMTAADSLSRVFAPIDNFDKKTCQSSATSESTRKSRDSTMSMTILNSKVSETWSKSHASKEQTFKRKKSSSILKHSESATSAGISELPVPRLSGNSDKSEIRVLQDLLSKNERRMEDQKGQGLKLRRTLGHILQDEATQVESPFFPSAKLLSNGPIKVSSEMLAQRKSLFEESTRFSECWESSENCRQDQENI